MTTEFDTVIHCLEVTRICISGLHKVKEISAAIFMSGGKAAWYSALWMGEVASIALRLSPSLPHNFTIDFQPPPLNLSSFANRLVTQFPMSSA
jgi:hypothetical protein